MPIVTLLPSQMRQPGNYAIGQAALNDAWSTIICRLDRSNWQDTGISCTLTLEYSLDGGQTWLSFNGFTAVGGDVLHPDTGVADTWSGFETALPAGTNRMLRGSLTTSGRFRQALEVEVS